MFNQTLLVIMIGAGALGALGGILGCYAVLRRQSLIGDALSHAALPGIVLAYMITSSQTNVALMSGAAIAGLIGVFCVHWISNNTRIKFDSALGVILSVFFGLGIVLLTLVQKWPDAGKAGLDKFLFGQAATLLKGDVYVFCTIAILSIFFVLLLWKEFKLLAFDPEFASGLGFSVRLLDYLLTSLIVISIVTGLQTVGVVLMSAVLVAPAAAARQWTDRLSVMVLLGGIIGMAAGISGATISSMISHFPTGPSIVLCLGICVVISLLFAPQRGFISVWRRQRKSHIQLRSNSVLLDLFELESQHIGEEQPTHSTGAIAAMSFGMGSVENTLKFLKIEGYITQAQNGEWYLTERGSERADYLFKTLLPGGMVKS